MMIHKAAPVVFAVAALALTRPAPAQDNSEIRLLIKQLGNPRFAEREQAERRLAQSDRAVAFIKQAVVSDPTPEVRRRCSRLLDQRRSGMCDDVARELERMAQRGEYARGTATAVAWRHDLRERIRDYQSAALESLTATVQLKTGRSVAIPKTKHRIELVLENGASTRCVIHTLFAVREMECANACTCGFLVSGNLRVPVTLTNCVVFVNGPVALRFVSRSVVFVDGDVTLEDANDSLIVCTGAVESQDTFENSTVISGGKIKVTPNSSKSLLRPEEKDLAALVQPWIAAELGVETVARDGRVYARRVEAKSPMGLAGAKPGDVLLSLDGETIANWEDAVKLLRRKSIEFLPFVARVKRGERDLELIVPWSAPR